MKVKSLLLMAVVALALALAALPVVGLRAGAAGSMPASARPFNPAPGMGSPVSLAPQAGGGIQVAPGVGVRASQFGDAIFDRGTLVGFEEAGAEPAVPGQYFRQANLGSSAQIEAQSLAAGGQGIEGQPDQKMIEQMGLKGISATESMKRYKQAEQRFRQEFSRSPQLQRGELAPQSNEPAILAANGATSAALATTIGGRDTQFDDVELLADWDGREDFVADRQGTIDDFSQKIPPPGGDWTLTRVALSAHSRANGYNENVYYYGDSFGNVFVAQSPTLNPPAGGLTGANIFSMNLPTLLNAFGSITSDDQVTITGICVQPVADLTSFGNVNGAFAPFFSGQTGEIVYVTYWDTGSGFRLASNNTLVRSGVLAFAVADVVSPPATPPAVQSPAGFPVTVGGAFGVVFSVFGNLAGCCVDDDGNLYFSQVDLIQFTGGNIVKVTDVGANQDRSLAVSGILTITTLNPSGGVYGTTSGPPTQVNRFTNYSGTSPTFGNITSLGCGACNTVYATVARSAGTGDDLASGRFAAPSAFSNGTPSMIISFADCAGAFDSCSAVGAFAGILPIGNGIADVAQAGQALSAGVNNFLAFALGTGPDIRTSTGTLAAVAPVDLLKIDMQFDFSIHNGIVVDENGTVFAVSGGTPTDIGPQSPFVGEIVVFPDECPMNRRGDFIDLRGNQFSNPPIPGGTVGDGDSDRFDHIFWQAPVDQISAFPTGIAGLARGFLRYLNRTAPIALPNLPNGVVQGDDSTNGPIAFEDFDPSHQVAGGDDQNPPFRGDDDNGGGNPPTPGPLSGGFEFVFGASGATVGGTFICTNVVWNAFFLNSNGNITFGTGDTDNTPSIPEFRGGLPKLAAAWTDLNPSSRLGGFLNTFPVQALGFASINVFKIRWINVPEFEFEFCGSRNTFSIYLCDDGLGLDENASQALNPANPIGNNAVPFDLQEGPSDLRFRAEPTTGVIIGCPKKPDGSGQFCFEYCRMDVLGGPGGPNESDPVLVGYSEGFQAITNPPGLCEIDLGEAARAADTDPFRPCLVGEGTEPTIFELFNEGGLGGVGSGGEVTFARPDFDLRFEGNDAALCTPARQADLNRGKVCFFGKYCPRPPQCVLVLPVLPVLVAPNQPAVGSAAAASVVNNQGQKVASPTAGIVNALCNVTLNMLGCGFIPNETTIICEGFQEQTGVPLQRPGKSVSSSMNLVCDTDGDGVPDLVIPLTNVTPINRNLVRGTLATAQITGSNRLPTPGSAFPFACCGGLANLTLTTTFTAGDNNQFGLFSLSTTCVIDLGNRAPVVISVTPSGPVNCGTPQDLIITGHCFILPSGQVNVTSVFAVELGNPNNRVNAVAFSVLSPNFIDADFNFGTANAGKTFLIFVSGPSGQSRNLISTDPRPAGCPIGNENGIQVTFRCQAAGPTSDPPVLTGCSIEGGRIIITGSNIKLGASVSVNGVSPRKVKFKGQQVVGGTTLATRLVIKGGCSGLPGPVTVINPGDQAGATINCSGTCQ